MVWNFEDGAFEAWNRMNEVSFYFPGDIPGKEKGDILIGKPQYQ